MQDHSAIVAVEEPEAHWMPKGMVGGEGLQVRYVERIPLGTKDPEVAGRVREIVSSPALRGKCALAVDAAGLW